MGRYCDVCCGSEKIRLPVYPRLSVVELSVSIDPDARETFREFPCPQCSEATVPSTHISVTCTEGLASSSQEDDPDYLRHVQRNLARNLADIFVEKGFVRFERSGTDDRRMVFSVKATVGVVSEKQVSTLQERVSAHQEALAREVMDEASRSISVWGSHYTGDEGQISKHQAIDSVNGALRKVLARRAETRPMHRTVNGT